MTKILTILPLIVLLASCSSTNKHKSIQKATIDSAGIEVSKSVDASKENLTSNKIQVDTAAKHEVETKKTKTSTTYTYQEIPADAVVNSHPDTRDYFPPSYKTKDGRQFIPVPTTTKEEETNTDKKETSKSEKKESAQYQKIDTSAKESAKQASVKKEITVKNKDVQRFNFNWLWLLLLIPAYLVCRYWKTIKKAIWI